MSDGNGSKGPARRPRRPAPARPVAGAEAEARVAAREHLGVEAELEMLAPKDALRVLAAISSRAALASALGRSFSGDRDLYEALGWEKRLTFSMLEAQYRRQDLSKAVIDAPVRACWRGRPTISETTGRKRETEFERRWDEIAKDRRLKLFATFSRLDRLASIGEYAVLLLGYGDTDRLETPIERSKDLLYVTPYSQENARIVESDKDLKSPRYGAPTVYELTPLDPVTGQPGTKFRVHHSRVLHVAEDCLGSDVFGLSRLEAPFNRLKDAELVAGGSAEMYWRGAFPGLGVEAEGDAEFDAGLGQQTDPKDVLISVRDEIERYVHRLQRYILLQGVKLHQLSPQVVSPDKHIATFVDLIAGAARIPKRILVGSERGELASSQDENNWSARIRERQLEHCEPNILRPFVDRQIELGVLPTPKEDYSVAWPDVATASDKDKAERAKAVAEAARAYLESGADELIPRRFFLTQILGVSEDAADEIERELGHAQRDADGEGEDEPPAGGDPEGEDDGPAGGDPEGEDDGPAGGAPEGEDAA